MVEEPFEEGILLPNRLSEQPTIDAAAPGGDQEAEQTSLEIPNKPPSTIPRTIIAIPQTATSTTSTGLSAKSGTGTLSATPTLTIITVFPTTTVSTNALAKPIVAVLTDASGAPIATVTEYLVYSRDNVESGGTLTATYYISEWQYFVGFFLPTLLSMLLAIPIRMIDSKAKRLQPWHELTRAGGAVAKDSLCLKVELGPQGLLSNPRLWFKTQTLPLLTTLLVVLSAVLVPLSSEAIALKLHGSCTKTDFMGCAMTLGVFLTPARAVMGVLGFMAVLVMVIMLVLSRWKSGVASDPWTIASVASLSTNPSVRALFTSLPTGREGIIRHEQLAHAFRGKTFKLDYFVNQRGYKEYGVVIHCGQGSAGPSSPDCCCEAGLSDNKTKHRLLSWLSLAPWRICFLVILTFVMVLILVYNNTGGDTPFENFMDSQSYGVRFLFSSLGVCISLFWTLTFNHLAMLCPFSAITETPQLARRSVAFSPPANAFTGIWSALKQRHMRLAIVAFMAILSEVLPVLLINVPFNLTQTWMTQNVCSWMAFAIISTMWLIVVCSFFLRLPHMPVDPSSTIAEAMFYVCESRMVERFEGLSVLGQKERDQIIDEMGLRFEFGDIVGVSGRTRVGVDAVVADEC
ncbi:hypothetical protein B0T17DRAFT_575352 [Bombardia bombarda]|uniref:Uncharacterized protein n=1 Tax=Bombardia bombarda TaxID=252184 RepID=A0AA40C8S3_9PEZI|nr:hypothetical protein B0T17DRAFT_575352 [Bombardia bombarda]